MRSALLVLLIAAFSALSAKADLVGETIQISRQIPIDSFIFGPFPYTVGASAPVALSGGNNLYASASGTDLFLTFGPGPGSGGPFPRLDHFILFDNLYAGTSTEITGVSFSTDVSGFVLSDVVFTGHSVKVGEGHIDYSGGQTMDITLQTSTVPEPGESMAVTIMLTILLLTRWRRNRNCRTVSAATGSRWPSSAR